MYNHILVPVDGTPEAERAVRHAVSLADLTGATIHALYVASTPSRGGRLTGRTGGDADIAERGERALEDARECAEDRDVAVETTVAEGDPAAVIEEFVAETNADLVVMGTHGREGVGRLLNGSVAEHVGRHVSVPVMTIRLGAGRQSVTSPLHAQQIAHEKLVLAGHEDAVLESPSHQRASWVVHASDETGAYNVHINSASGRAELVRVK